MDQLYVDSNTLTIEGSFDNFQPHQIVSAYILKEGASPESINNATGFLEGLKNLAMACLKTSGNYTISMPFNEGMEGHKLYVKSGKQSVFLDIQSLELATQTIYVSPFGNDDAFGTEDYPLMSIEGAKNRIRKLKEQSSESSEYQVVFMPGIYKMKTGAVFSKQDSGTAAAPITYRAQTAGTAVFTGTVNIPVNSLTLVDSSEELALLPQEAVGHVYKVNLGDFGITQNQVIFKNESDASVYERAVTPAILGLYLNNKRQNIARYPNVGYNDFYLQNGDSAILDNGYEWTYSEDVPSPLEYVRGASFTYDNQRFNRWENANQMFIDGFLTNQYFGTWRAVDKIDTENRKITLKDGSISAPNRRWTAVNLLEELDYPSEFFIDRETLTLYYYPAYDLKEHDTLEYAYMQEPFVTLDDVSHVNFKGLNFTKSYGGGIIGSRNNNILIDNCDISFVRGNAIRLNQTTNTEARNNRVHSISGNGISIRANESLENIYSMVNCGNKAINNHVYNVGMELRTMSHGIAVTGFGGVSRNNQVHLSPNMGIGLGGPESEVSYNEIYNLMRDTADGGGIYIGRAWDVYGVKYEYNYLHDFGIENFHENEHTSGIFLDDTISGHSVTNNIIVNNYQNTSYGININGGRDIDVKNNVFIGGTYAIRNTDRTNSDIFQKANNRVMLDNLASVVNSGSLYAQKYPQMTANYREITDETYEDYTGKFNPKNLDFSENVFYDLKNKDGRNGVVTGGRIDTDFAQTVVKTPNFIPENDSPFVDFNGGDYRIKTAVKESLGYLDDFKLDESFDMDSIGLIEQDEVYQNSVITGDSFAKINPKNGGASPYSNRALLSWEQAEFADKYLYTVSKNQDLSSPIASIETVYKNAVLQGLESNTTYYWNVTAVNNGRKSASQWDSQGGVYSFKTGDYFVEVVDFVAKTEGEQVNVSLVVEPLEGCSENADLFVVGYNERREMTSIQLVPVNVYARTLEISFEHNKNTDHYAALLWKSGSMIPQVKYKVLARN